MRQYPVYQVDAFTDTPFTGNPAGVVLDADGLSHRQMQSIARELNNSETAFVLKPDGSDHDVRVRFFTPSTEVPSCGHATIAAHYVRATEGGLGPHRVVQKIGAGLLPVDVEREGDDYRVVITQGRVTIHDPLPAPIADEIVDALGVSDSRDAKFPLQVVDTGHSKVMVGVRDGYHRVAHRKHRFSDRDRFDACTRRCGQLAFAAHRRRVFWDGIADRVR